MRVRKIKHSGGTGKKCAPRLCLTGPFGSVYHVKHVTVLYRILFYFRC
jgi:hypothetical protein